MNEDRTYPPLVADCLFLAGPTAAGKSTVGVELAELLDGEILSLDSIAVYRRMDIGTAKPDQALRARIPHHLLDLAEPHESFSITAYLEAAHACVATLLQRNKLPIFVGGTPLFMKALLRGFYSGPPADWDFRESVERDANEHGLDALYQRLQQVDPLSAHRIAPNDLRRMTRALEVAYVTGQPLSHWQQQFDDEHPAAQGRVFALRISRQLLHERIHRRVDQMFAAGLVGEVRSICEHAGDSSRAFSKTASQAVGYRETLAFLRGEMTEAQLVEEVKTHTRQLAKRQETWLRSMQETRFIDIDADSDAKQVACEIKNQLETTAGSS